VDGDTSSSKTFILEKEDHTLGNALRYAIMRQPETTFSGYTIPHPSEYRVYLRVQTTGADAKDTLCKGASDLREVAGLIESQFDEALDSFWEGKSGRPSLDTRGLGPLALPEEEKAISKSKHSKSSSSAAMDDEGD